MVPLGEALGADPVATGETVATGADVAGDAVFVATCVEGEGDAVGSAIRVT
jgi:hypothetical protein